MENCKKRLLAFALSFIMLVSAMPVSVFAESFDEAATGDYFKVISENKYNLAPGATETELVVNNAVGNDRKVVHYFEVDTKNENIEVLPGYYGIDKLDPDNIALDGVEDKSEYWKAEQLTKTVAYYEDLGYNVVGAMNTALSYSSNAPCGYMVMNGVVLGTPEVHSGAKTYLAIDAEGNCELRSISTPLDGSEVTAISANFSWLVQNGELVSKTVERTSSDASRSMIGIKADGTLVFCQVDGRNAPLSSGLSNYEMGEMMLALGCVNAVNCDGGGSSTFISKREGEKENIMRSIPSDGSERATINSVIIVSKAKPTGEFDHAVLSTEYDYYAPTTSAKIDVKSVDSAGSPAELPKDGISWTISDSSFGSISDGIFTSNGKKGEVEIQMLYNGEVVGEKLIKIVDPDVFEFFLDETVLPYGKSMEIKFNCTYGVDNWSVCVDGAYRIALSNNNAATIEGNTLIATNDETITGVNITATYIPDISVSDVLKVTYGKGSEVIYDFEDGDTVGFMSFEEAKQWSLENNVNNTLVGSAPLGNNFSPEVDGDVFISDKHVRNGKYALAWSLDNTNADFSKWVYNVIYNVGENVVLRDVENGKNAISLGMWLYIPEGAAGLSFQSQFFSKNEYGILASAEDHFKFITVDGTVKNLNSCTEADIPESRWVYISIDISKYYYLSTYMGTNVNTNRTPSFIRTYIKPMTPAVHTFYIDDITLDYSSAVEDRVLPSISDISYSEQDTLASLNNGATINGNSISFSAVIKDNIGLDYATGKILIDGNEISNVSASGNYLTTISNINIPSGVHTVAFEIKDEMGNPMKVTRTFTVAGESQITLGGHNDSGEKPEYGSIYYVDVNTVDITKIDKVSVSLYLQNANTWEPQGITVAAGFDFNYTLDSIGNILTINIERNGEEVDVNAKTLISAPVRLWTWDGVNKITGQIIDSETHYATGSCPIVTIECEVIKGLANEVNPFGGKISVETMINDTVNPWHYHDTELTVMNKEATCVVDGYTNRTYCETCKSVIEWGTAVEAKGHDYKVVDNSLVCNCGGILKSNGLHDIGGKTYYVIEGILMTGWQFIGNDWYYFHKSTSAGAEGNISINGITYTFDNGLLTEGVWVADSVGTRYYYGPNYYKATNAGFNEVKWQDINGSTYGFDLNGYRYENICCILESNRGSTLYEFTSDGKLIGEFVTDETGLIACNKGRFCYVVEGMPTHEGLVLINGALYYIDSSCMAVIGEKDINAYWSNGLMPAGTYSFGEDGKMVLDETKKNGLVTEDDGKYYYINDAKMYAGFIAIDGSYYYFDSDYKAVTGKCFVTKTNRLLNEGYFNFDEEGKLIIVAGDIDNNCSFGTRDVTIARRYLTGEVNPELNVTFCDVDGNSLFNARDITLMRRYLSGGYGFELTVPLLELSK